MSLLRGAAFDYVALGHIHCHQVLGEDPPIVYSGSLDRIDFGEEREAKGFVVAEVERGSARYEFVELKSTRRFVTIRVDADGADPMAQVRHAIARHDIKDAIVRLIIHTTMDRNQMVRDSEIGDLLGDAFKVAAVVRDVERPSRLRLGTSQNVERMAPLEALSRYLELREVPNERAELLLEYAERVIKPVDTGAD